MKITGIKWVEEHQSVGNSVRQGGVHTHVECTLIKKDAVMARDKNN
jgi:hypothetical protein